MKRMRLPAIIMACVLFTFIFSAVGFAASQAWDFEDSSTEGLTIHGVPQYWRVAVDPLVRGRVLQIAVNSYRTDTQLRALGTYALLDSEYEDVTVEVDVRFSDISNSGSAGVIFGYQDDQNYYYVYFHPTAPKIRLNDAGSLIDLVVQTEGPYVEHGAYYRAKVVRKGSTVQVYLDDQLIMKADDDTFTTGQVGIGSWNHSTYFDNLSVTAD